MANVVGRAELLAFTVGAGALVLWQQGEDAGRRDRRLLRWSGSGLLLFGAFSAKESAVAWVGFFFVEGALAVTPRSGPSAAPRAEARLALVEALVRLGREDEARSHARGLAEDRFAPLEQRQLAGGIADALDQPR